MFQSMMRTAVVFVAVVTCASAELIARTWTSADGKFTVEAEFIEVNGPDVTIRTAAGKEITIAMSKLSQKDRDFVLAEKKKATAKPADPAGSPAVGAVAAGDKPGPSRIPVKGGKGPQLVPFNVKPRNITYTLDVPAGAVLNKDLPQERIVAGERFALMVHDYGDLKSFRETYGPGNAFGYVIKQKLIDDETTAVYAVQDALIDKPTLVFATEVTIGGTKVVVCNTEIDVKPWTADDVNFMLKCAKTIRLAKPEDQRVATKPLMVGGKEPKLVPLDFTTRNVTYTFSMPVGATTDNFGDGPEGHSRVQMNEQEILEMRPGSKEDLAGFKGYFGPMNKKGYEIKKTLIDDETTVEYIVHNPARGVDEVVFITIVPAGDKIIVCHNSMVLENNLSEADAALLIKCIKTLKAK